MCSFVFASNNTLSRADSRFERSQWDTVLLCSDISHWLGASLESTMIEVWTRRRHFAVNTLKCILFMENIFKCNLIEMYLVDKSTSELIIQFNSIQFETNLLSNKVQNTTSWVWLHDSDSHGQDQYEYTHNTYVYTVTYMFNFCPTLNEMLGDTHFRPLENENGNVIDQFHWSLVQCVTRNRCHSKWTTQTDKTT